MPLYLNFYPRVAVDAAGHIYVAGVTRSHNFPLKNAFQTTFNGHELETFITKLDPTRAGAASLVYSTYLGGQGYDGSTALTVDAAGQAHVLLYTRSPDLPTTPGALQPVATGSTFLAKLSAAGDKLLYGSYLTRGINFWIKPMVYLGEQFTGVAVDAKGNIYLSGYTADAGFPVTPEAVQVTFGGGRCGMDSLYPPHQSRAPTPL